MVMAAAAAKALRGGRSGLASGLLPAIGRRGLQESMLLGSSAATPAGSMGRLMHTGHWRNPIFSEGGSVHAPRRMEQFCSKSFLHSKHDDDYGRLPNHPVTAMAAATFAASMISLMLYLPSLYRQAKGLFRHK